MRLGFGLFFLAGVLVACPGPTFIVQQYKGPVRDQETIAILRVNGADSVRLLTLDDEDVAAPIESDSRLHIEMLPAQHRVTVANAKAPSERYEPLVFIAHANHVYRVAFVESSAHIYDVDRSTDRILNDVTIAKPPEDLVLPSVTKPKPPAPKIEEDAAAPLEAPLDGGAP
jgi:hypothetical protein